MVKKTENVAKYIAEEAKGAGEKAVEKAKEETKKATDKVNKKK